MYRDYKNLQDIVDWKNEDDQGEKAYEGACEIVGGDFETFLAEHEIIAEEDFAGYAEEYADDLYNVDFSTWPFNCVDWEQAASDLQSDYTCIEIDGKAYYYNY